ncbi:MAG: cyclase family protein [Deltaproteobacteria bacterium]|nr:cyclase family protein [Deltaproteobacteria bacterium]
MKVFDVSIPIRPDMHVWPGIDPPEVKLIFSHANGDGADVTRFDMCVHTGTHVDAPRHFIADGGKVKDMDLGAMVGPAYVGYLPEVDIITAADLERLPIPAGCERLLLKTKNSQIWQKGLEGFQMEYVHLSHDASSWIVDHGIRLVGVDYLSVDEVEPPEPVSHLTLLGGRVVIIEGVVLTDIEPGEYQLYCLPIRLENAEGAPARVILVDESA